jgi:hypothetical protein
MSLSIWWGLHHRLMVINILSGIAADALLAAIADVREYVAVYYNSKRTLIQTRKLDYQVT